MVHYGNYEYAEQVQLMLGILYSRYLNEPEKAVTYLKAALEHLHDPGQRKMCKDELDRLRGLKTKLLTTAAASATYLPVIATEELISITNLFGEKNGFFENSFHYYLIFCLTSPRFCC